MFAPWKESPLVPYFTCFSCGILLYDLLSIDIPTREILFVLAFLLVFLVIKNRAITLFITLLLTAFSGYFISSFQYDKSSIKSDREEYIAKIITTPKQSEKAQFATIQLVEKDSISDKYVLSSQHVSAIILNTSPTLFLGDFIAFSSSARAIQKGENKYASYLIRQGIYHKMFIKSFKVCGKHPTPWSIQIKNWFNTYVLPLNSSKHNALINGICFGDKSGFDASTIESFKSAGFMHLLAVSGMHIGFISLLCNYILSLLFKSYKGKKISTCISIAFVWFYITIAGFTPSALRAGIMLSIYFCSELLEKDISKYQVLALSGLIILAISPSDLFSISFQLSFAAMLGIIWIYRLYNHHFKISGILSKPVTLIIIGIGAQIGTLPLCLYYFGFYPTYSLLAGTLASFIVFALMTISFCLIPLSFLEQTHWLEPIINFLSKSLVFLAEWVETLPHSTISLQINAIVAISLSISTILLMIVWERQYLKLKEQILY